MITNMTVGSPGKILFLFSVPMLLSAVFQQLYNIADSVVAGNFIGKNALAAVGASYPITMIFMAVAIGLSIGCTVVISRFFGAGDYRNMKTAIFTSLFAAAGSSLFFTLVGLLFCKPLLLLLQTSPVILHDSELYLNVSISGLFFLFLYNSSTGIFTALGDSKTPLYFLIASSVGNIVLDVVFVVTFKMGVGGIAWATFLCQGVCSILAVICLLRRVSKIKTIESYPKYSTQMLKNISRIAVPSILQQSFISIGNLFIQGLVNGFGVDVTAGYSAAIRLNTFAVTAFTTMGNSMSSFTSQNMGAKKSERVKSGLKKGILLVGGVVLPFTLAFWIFAPQMIRLFLNSGEVGNTGAIVAGTHFLRIVSPFYIIVAIKVFVDGVLRGAGAMKAFMIATFTDLILRVILSYLLAIPFASNGIWLSWPIGWTIAALLSCIFYGTGKWQNV